MNNYTIDDITEAEDLKEHGFNWISRDSDCELIAYKEKPKKSVSVWQSTSSEDTPLKLDKILFKSISFNDNQPTSIDDIIESSDIVFRDMIEVTLKPANKENKPEKRLILIKEISQVVGCFICLRDNNIFECVETYPEIKNKLYKAMNYERYLL